MTLAKQIKIVNKRIKMTIYIHVFARKLRFIKSTYSISPNLSPSQTQFAQVDIRANVVSATLTILSAT